jgi:FkbM family methyltransferase
MTNDLIYDIGMHNGSDTAFYLACGYRVVAVDADPDLVAAAKTRFKAEIESKRLTILNVGIAEQSGTATFWINEIKSTLNSFSREITARDGYPIHPIEIQCQRLDEIIREHGVPYYIKIDIEGFDIVCCNQLSAGNKPEYISVEMSRIELLLRLRDLGYDRFKLIPQVDHQAIGPHDTEFHIRVLRRIHRLANYNKENRAAHLRIVRKGAAMILQLATAAGFWGLKPYKSRRLPEWNFPDDVTTFTGSFGEDLPGEWMSWEELAHIWHRDLREYRKLQIDFWCDLHAHASAGKINTRPSGL